MLKISLSVFVVFLGGTLAKDCIFSGKSYPDKKEFSGSGFFFYCENGIPKLRGCSVGSPEINVPTGEARFANGKKYTCQGGGNSITVFTLVCRTPDCKAEKDAHEKGKPKTTGGGDNKDSSKPKGPQPKDKPCEKDGQYYAVGPFQVPGFEMNCKKDGAYTITACISPRDKTHVIKIGETSEKCGWTRICVRTGFSVSLQEMYSSSKDKCKTKPKGTATVTETGSTGGLTRTKGTTGTGTGSTIKKALTNNCRDAAGATKGEGEVWRSGRVKYTCKNKNRVAVSCFDPTGKHEIKVGEKKETSSMITAQCQVLNGQVVFFERPTNNSGR